MAAREHQPKGPREPALDLAIGAVEGHPSVMHMPMARYDPSPDALDLPVREHAERCSRRGPPAVDRCPGCGSPLCEDRVSMNEGWA
jgi:hypothetical protein